MLTGRNPSQDGKVRLELRPTTRWRDNLTETAAGGATDNRLLICPGNRTLQQAKQVDFSEVIKSGLKLGKEQLAGKS